MAFDSTPNKLESAFIQRNINNSVYEQVNISGSNLIFYHSSSGEFTADKIPVWASKYALGGRSIVMCSSLSPASPGPSFTEIPIPYAGDGITPISWSISKFTLRVNTSGSSPSQVTFEKSSGIGIFNPVTLGTLNLNSNTYEASTGSFTTIVSGDKIRFNITSVGNANYWTIVADITTL